MTGSAGTDIVGDGAGADHVDLAAGDDRLIVAQDEDADTCEEGEGTDTLDLSRLTDGVTVDLATGALTRTDAATDGIDGFEVVIGPRTVASYMIKPIIDRFSHACVRDESQSGSLGTSIWTFPRV